VRTQIGQSEGVRGHARHVQAIIRWRRFASNLTIVIGGESIRMATVRHDATAGLYLTYIGLPVSGHQLGLHDTSEDRAVKKAEEFLRDKLRRLL
jgi:hypothetical protein